MVRGHCGTRNFRPAAELTEQDTAVCLSVPVEERSVSIRLPGPEYSAWIIDSQKVRLMRLDQIRPLRLYWAARSIGGFPSICFVCFQQDIRMPSGMRKYHHRVGDAEKVLSTLTWMQWGCNGPALSNVDE